MITSCLCLPVCKQFNENFFFFVINQYRKMYFTNLQLKINTSFRPWIMCIIYIIIKKTELNPRNLFIIIKLTELSIYAACVWVLILFTWNLITELYLKPVVLKYILLEYLVMYVFFTDKPCFTTHSSIRYDLGIIRITIQ